MSLLRGCSNVPHSAFSKGRRRPPGAIVCCAQHRVRQATSHPELLAVAELCAQEFSSTGLSARLGGTSGGALSDVLSFIEGAMAKQAVRELLRRFTELEDRKKAGEVRHFVHGSGAGVVACLCSVVQNSVVPGPRMLQSDQHRSALRQLNLIKDIKSARDLGKHRYADDLELLLSEAQAFARCVCRTLPDVATSTLALAISRTVQTEQMLVLEGACLLG